MEEDFEDVPKPDYRGVMELTHKAWSSIDPIVWTFAKSILILEVLQFIEICDSLLILHDSLRLRLMLIFSPFPCYIDIIQ